MTSKSYKLKIQKRIFSFLFPGHSSSIAWNAAIRRDVPWQLPCSGKWQNSRQNSSVCIVTRLRAARRSNRGSVVGRDTFVSSSKRSDPLFGYPLPYSMGTRHEEAETKSWPYSPIQFQSMNAWTYTSTSLYIFMAWASIRRRENFTYHAFSIFHTFALLYSSN
jgi:hypothetical protein